MSDTALTLKPADVAKELEVDRDTATRMMADGTIQAVNLGSPMKRKRWRTCRAWLDAFHARRGQTVGSQASSAVRIHPQPIADG